VGLLTISILGFLVALTWEEVLKITFQEFIKNSEFWGRRFLYPISLTIIAILISTIIGRFFTRKRRRYDRNEGDLKL
jgi:hypothetical protein